MTSNHNTDSSDNSWRLCRGPANWFTFRCPEAIDVRQNQTLIELRLRSTEDSAPVPHELQGPEPLDATVLSMVTWWDDAESDATRRPSPDLTVLFPQVVELRPEASLQIDAANEVWSGISRRPAAGCWLARVFGRKPRYQWRLWTIRHGRLTIVATVQSAEREVLNPGFVMLCERILGTLQIADHPAWPPDMFLKQVIELARQRFPLLQAAASRGFSLKLGHSEIGLSNFYRMYLQQPDSFRRIVLPALTTLVRLQELSPEQLVPALEEVRDNILPMLSADDDARIDERVRTPWVGGLSVGYVMDEDASYRYVHQSMLENWHLSLEELHELAIQNLQQYASENPLEVTMVGDESDPGMLMPVKADAYNSSRILDPKFHVRLREMFGPELIVGVPNRDFFVAVTMKDRALIEQVRVRVNEDFATMHHPLTRRLLVVSADGVSEYCEI